MINIKRKINNLILIIFGILTSILQSLGLIMEQPSTPEAKALVKETLTRDKVVIFSKTYCPYCVVAKEVFQKLKQPYQVLELDDREDGPAIQSSLQEITGKRTVPQVFINGKFIGGGTDVQSLYLTGKLARMLE